ncbi:class I SAM-dependent methyltransferase [Skermania piniformis]|uniref:Class I SAM-dependent methyltransferase n=1 Tax=Skermania pinensis TaxID=39122 RepID=A0ABX8SCT5_9ACTN|nr:class I SAM-dependent methyltransferase [Skermania piniformis]QXQ14982.1 class I SAM-dependent methyltransferase [Skermania piniformis]
MTVYDQIGLGYATRRTTDERWMAPIRSALAGAARVVNVGAGTGSYEPPETVLAIEPSAAMIAQRAAGTAPVVRGVAERLPLGDGVADAALAVLTVHHWADWRRGLAELKRIARRQVVVAYEVADSLDFWLLDYLPEIAEVERSRPTTASAIADVLEAGSVIPLPVPWDFTDGVLLAHWRRPEAYLDSAVQRGCSALAQLDPDALEHGLSRLRADLESGRWAQRYGELLGQQTYDGGYFLVVSEHDGGSSSFRAQDLRLQDLQDRWS